MSVRPAGKVTLTLFIAATVKFLAREGAVVVANPPAEFDAYVRAEIAQRAKLIGEMKL